ncbi:hypothetical protein E2C01_037404 [Portunus trituberculatus]|uniref:Uncharacterized protein n=1 Tax=Portunus trituberculatus TaxID=210409 RepID=A0A5B7FBB9_PORTR|nr:hypothetical protein [Portunus trituberculatus]
MCGGPEHSSLCRAACVIHKSKSSVSPSDSVRLRLSIFCEEVIVSAAPVTLTLTLTSFVFMVLLTGFANGPRILAYEEFREPAPRAREGSLAEHRAPARRSLTNGTNPEHDSPHITGRCRLTPHFPAAVSVLP